MVGGPGVALDGEKRPVYVALGVLLRYPLAWSA